MMKGRDLSGRDREVLSFFGIGQGRRCSPAVAFRPGAQAAVWALVVLVLPAQAAGQTFAVPDPIAATDGEELAAAVSLLVRASLAPGRHTIVSRRQLALAIEATTGRTPGKNLTVTAELARKIAEQLGAESVVVWELEVTGKGTQVGGTVVASNGKRLARISAAAATGDLAELARQLAGRVASAVSVATVPTPDLGLADLRPFLQAQVAYQAQDGVAVTRALDLALPKVAGKSTGAKQILRDIADDPGMTALPRAQAAILMGDWGKALERAEAGLSSDGKNVLLRVAKIRALAARKDFEGAEREFPHLKGSPSLLALAQVAVAVERGDSGEKLALALAPLLGRPATEWRAVLPLIATAPPGSFGARAETAALAAAEKLSQQEPGLASTLAARALAGGAKAQDAAPLIKVQDLSAEQVKVLSGSLSDQGGDAAAGLGQQIKAREEEAKLIAATAGPERPTGPPSLLASNLRAVLRDFDGLYDPKLSAIQIAPLPGSGQPLYWPYLIRRQRLGEGLLEALMRPPWELRASAAKVQTETLPSERFSEEGMASLAHDMEAAAVLFYRVRPAGFAPWVTLELYLHDTARQRTDKIETAMVGRSTGLMVLSPLWIALFVLACIGAGFWVVLLSLRGTVVVRVQWDSDAKDEMFCILISRSPHTPTIESITAFRKKMEWIGKRKRRFQAWNIGQNTTFRGIPRGKWQVHLFGVYTRGRQTLQLHEPPQEVLVQARKSSFVAHVLEAAEAEFKITVVDKQGPVEAARVWLDDQRAKATAAGKDGCVTLKVPKGFHVIHVSARGMDVERPYHVVKAKVHEMTINLVWEKRQEYVSRALERQVDEAAPYMTKSARRSPPTSIPVLPSPPEQESAPESPDPSGPAKRGQATEEIKIRLEDTPAPAAEPALPSASSRPSAPKPAVARLTMSLRPLAPEFDATAVPPTNLRGMGKSASSASPDASDAVDLNMVPDPEPPVDLVPVDLASTTRREPAAPPAPLPPTPPSRRGR
jgi:hypothetical protein